MKNILFILFISTSILSFSQKSKTIYLNCNYEPVRKKKALYKQIVSTKEVEIRLNGSNTLIKRIELINGISETKETDFWKNGNKYSVIHYKNKQKHGEATLYQWTGELKQTSQYVDGVKQGKEINYNFDKEIISKYTYKRGKKNGEAIFFVDDSTKKYYNYKNGKRHGLYLKKKLPNITIDSANYKDGKLDGVFTTFYESGKLKYSINQRKGKRDGWFKRYYETGELMDIAHYENGSILKIDKGYHIDGSLKDFTNYFDGKKSGLSVGFYSNGNPEWRRNYKKGKLIGVNIDYWENGKMKFKSVYEDGERTSQTCYDEEGKEIECGFDEINPMFKGGEQKLFEYLSKTISYPQEVKECGIRGKVYVKFYVEKDGSLTNFEIIRGVHRSLDEEALEAIKNMPKWNPGEQKGKKVRVRFILPVNFTLR